MKFSSFFFLSQNISLFLAISKFLLPLFFNIWPFRILLNTMLNVKCLRFPRWTSPTSPKYNFCERRNKTSSRSILESRRDVSFYLPSLYSPPEVFHSSWCSYHQDMQSGVKLDTRQRFFSFSNFSPVNRANRQHSFDSKIFIAFPTYAHTLNHARAFIRNSFLCLENGGIAKIFVRVLLPWRRNRSIA